MIYKCIFLFQLLYVVSAQTVVASSKPRIYYLHIKSDIRYTFATTSVISKVVNPAENAQEALFDVTLPNDAFITNFTLLINGKLYQGEVKEKAEAKKQYEEAKKAGQSAGIITTKPRETNEFQLQVNVAAGEKVTFELRYQELLRRTKGVYSHVIYVDPRQVIDDLKVEVAIEDSRDITTLRVPPLRNDLLTDVDITATNTEAVVSRPTPKSAYILYMPTRAEQEAMSNQGISGQFVVEYDVDRQNDAGVLLVVNGYFVHFFAPSGIDPLPMDVIFVLDKSGSMSGTKMNQLQNAMLDILDDIRPDDRFTVMTFDNSNSFWYPELVQATADNVKNAKEFVQKIPAVGGTNINGALAEGIRLLNTQSDGDRAPVLIFLTDGQPTSGETRLQNILSNVRSANEIDIPIFSLAFGRGADYNFVKKVAAQNNGFGRRIYEDSDSSLQISGFYDEVSTALMKNISFKYLGDVNETTVTRQICNTFFDGSEVVISGLMNTRSDNKVSPVVSGIGKGGIVITLVLPEENTVPGDEMKLNLTKDSDFAEMTEKMWAYLTIKELLKKKDALTEDEEESDLNKEILDLSLKYNFVTPLTSMVVTLPKEIQARPISTEENTEKLGEAGRWSSLSRYGGGHSLPARLVGSSYNSQSVPILQSLPSFSQHNFKRKSRKKGIRKKSRKRVKIPRVQAMLVGDADITAVMAPTTTTTIIAPTVTATTQPKITTTSSQKVKMPKRNKVKRMPMFLVKIPGISIPLCMDLNMDNGKRYRLLEEKSTGNTIATKFTSRRKAGSRRKSKYPMLTQVSYEGSVGGLRQGEAFTACIKSEKVALNVTLGDLEVLVTQQCSRQNGYLQVQGSYSSRSKGAFDGILGFFSDLSGRILKRKTIVPKKKKKSSRIIAKLKLKDGKRKAKLWASLVMYPAHLTDSCWFIKQKYFKKLGLQVSNYKYQ